METRLMGAGCLRSANTPIGFPDLEGHQVVPTPQPNGGFVPPFHLMRPLVVAAAVALIVILAVPAPPALAHDAVPPFEFSFPQDLKATSFSDTWGAHRPGGRRHKGTDLMAEKMTEVYAFADGVIAKIGSSRRAGRYLIIEHGDGWDTYYMHLNNDTPGTDDGRAGWDLTVAPGLDVGSRLVAGQLIGRVGDSGNAEGSSPHTHFELLHNGRNLNPHEVLAFAFERDVAESLRRPQAQGALGLVIV